MSVRLLPAAQTELDQAVLWYAQQAPVLGDSFLVELLGTIRLIERHPQGWTRPDGGRAQHQRHRMLRRLLEAVMVFPFLAWTTDTQIVRRCIAVINTWRVP